MSVAWEDTRCPLCGVPSGDHAVTCKLYSATAGVSRGDDAAGTGSSPSSASVPAASTKKRAPAKRKASTSTSGSTEVTITERKPGS